MLTTLLATAAAIAIVGLAVFYAEGGRRHRRRVEHRMRGIDVRVGTIIGAVAPPRLSTFGIAPATWNSATQLCDTPPAGWVCTRTPGHDGPCAALPIGERRRRDLITAHAGEVVAIRLDEDTAYTITRLDDDGCIVVAQAPAHDGPWTDAVVIAPPRNERLGSTQVQLPDDPVSVMARARGVHADSDEGSLDEIDVCGYTPSTADGLPCIREPHDSDNHVDATGREWTGGMAPHEREAYEFQAAVQRTIIEPPLDQDETVEAPWCASQDCPNEHRIDTPCESSARAKALQEYAAGIERAAKALTPVVDLDDATDDEHHPGAQGHVPAAFIRPAIDTHRGEIVSATVQHLNDQHEVIAEQPATIEPDGRITAKATCTWECPNPCVEHADKDAINGRHPDGTRRCRTEGCNASPNPGKAWCAACYGTPEPSDGDEDTQPEAPTVTRTIEQVQQAQTSGSLDDKLVRAECEHCDWTTDPAPVMQLDQAIDRHLAECPGLAESRATAARTATATEVGNDAIAEASPAIAERASSTINQRASSTFDAAPAHDTSKLRPGTDPIEPAKKALVPGLSTPAPKTVPAAGADPIPEGWATIKDAAAAVGRSDITVHGWATKGKLEHREVPNPGRGKATVRIVRLDDVQRVADESPTRAPKA